MAVKPTLDLFGGFDLFQTPQVALSREATSLFNDVETSSAVEKAFAEMQAQAKANDQIAQNVLKQQEAYQQQVAKAHEESTRRLAEAIKERQRQEEEARKEAEKRAKEAKEALDKNPTALIDADLSEFLNSEAFKKAGDLRQMHMAQEKAIEIEKRLLAQGVGAEAAKRSASTFLGNVQGEVTRLKNEADTSTGWITDIGSMIAKTFNDQQSAGNTKDAGLILDAQEAIKRGQKVSGWTMDEVLDANPNVRKYLKKTTNLGLDSLSTFAIRDDLTLEQRRELDAEITKAYNIVKAKEAQNIKEADAWYNNVSREQQIERDNYQFELQQASLKYSDPNAPIHTAEGMAMAAESAAIAAKYPITLAVDQSGSIAVGIGGGLVQAGVGLALAPVTGGASTANTAIGLARAANTLKNVSGVLFNGIASAKMVEADVINSSRDGILNTEISVLAKANPELWADMMEASGGNAELARQRLATMRADDHTGKAMLLGFVAGALGPETLITRAINKNLATQAVRESVEGIAAQTTAGITARSIAKNVGLWGVSTTAEGAEEGLTTYLTNLTIRGVNPDHDLWDGVSESVGMGAMVGGMMSSTALTTGAYGDIRRGVSVRDKAVAVSPLTDAAIEANVAKYKAAGDVDFNTLRQTMMNDLNAFESNISNAFATSPDAIKRQRQMYYDTYIDNQEILSSLTKSQQNELKEISANAFGGSINTNAYSVAQDTSIMQVLRDATKPPVVNGQTNTELLDLWRVVHNKELDQVVDAKKANTMAQLYKRMFPEGVNTEENTRQRAERMTTIMRDLVNENSSISARDKAEYLRTAATYFDTVPRRDGDKVDVATGPSTDQGTNSTDDGRGVFGDEQTPASEETPTTDNGQADADIKSTGDGGQGQANQSGSGTEPATEPSAVAKPSVQGPRETPQAEATADPAGTPDISSATTTSKGGTGATNQATGPDVVTNTQATPTTTGGGVIGTPETERSTDGERNTTTTETDTVGGNNGNSTETSGVGIDNSPFGTEVRNAENVTLSYRRAGEATTWSYQAQRFELVSPSERDLFVRVAPSKLLASADTIERYLLAFSDADLVDMHNRYVSAPNYDAEVDFAPYILNEIHRRNITIKPVEVSEEVDTIGETPVTQANGMVLSRRGVDGVVITQGDEYLFVPYSDAPILVLDKDATIGAMGLSRSTTEVIRPNKYEKRLRSGRKNINNLLEEIHQSLDVKQSVFAFDTESTETRSAKVPSEEELDRALDDAIGSIMNQMSMSLEETLDFIEYTIAGKLYNDGQFNELPREMQVRLVQDLAIQLQQDATNIGIGRIARANFDIAEADRMAASISQAGVYADIAWLDIYSRFNRAETVKVHGKKDPIVGTADLVRELKSIKAASDRAMDRIIPDTISNLSPESAVTLNTLVRVINEHNELDLLDTNAVMHRDVVISLLQASDSVRKKALTSYAKLVPESEYKVFRKALTSLTNDLVDTNAVAREVALSEATKPAYKRKATDREIKPRLRSRISSAVDTQTEDTLPPRVRRTPSTLVESMQVEFPQPKQSKQARLVSRTRREATPTVIRDGVIGERAKLVRDLETMSFSDNDLPQQVLMAIQTEPNPRQDLPTTKRESSAEVIKNLIHLATWQGSDININTDNNLSVAGVVDITENGAEITLQNGHDLDTMTHELAHAITAHSIMSGNFEQEVDFLNNLADRLHGSLDTLRLQNVDKSALRRDLSYVQAVNDSNAKAAEMTALLFENRDIWQAITRLDGTPVKKRKGLLGWIDNTLDTLRTLLGAGSTQLSNDTFDVVTKLIMGGKTNNAKGVTKLFSKKRTSKTKQENSNETQEPRSEQPTSAEPATDEDGQNELGVVPSSNEQGGAIRGPGEKQNTLNSQEVTSEEISNESSNDNTTGDLPITNEQSEQVDAAARDATQSKKGNKSKKQRKGNKTSVTADELSASSSEIVNNEPAMHNNQPVAIEGTTPSDQVAKIEPVVTEDGTVITEVLVPEGEHTPAEQEASDKFDTDPIPSDVTAEDGRSIYEIAIELADSVGYATLDVINPNKLSSKKNKKGGEATPAPDEKRPTDKVRKDRLYTNENALLREVRERLYDTVQKSDNTRAQWLEFMLATENGGDLLELINSTEFIQSGIDAAMSDSSVASAREPIEKFWVWNPKHTNPKYKDEKFGGVRAAAQKVGSVIAGITPHFDDWVNNIPGVPRTGMAQDSNVVSVTLGKIEAQRGAIHGFIHKTYIQPVLDLTRDMSFKYSQHENEVGTDFGNYATYTHVLEEGATALFVNAEQEIAYLKDRISAIVKEAKELHGDFASDEFTAETLFDDKLVKSHESRLADHQKDSYKELVADYRKLTSEVEKAERNLARSKDVYYGRKSRTEYSTGVKLPNGMTKAELEQELQAFEVKYDKADLEAVADKIYHAYRGMQATGVAYGAYDSQTLKEFNSNKFKKYVPLYHAKKDKPNEYEEDVVNESMFDGFEDESLIHQYKTLGLTRDISRFRRKGSVSRGQDAITNLGLAARNLSGRAASVEFEQNIQGLFEGTLDQPVLEGKPTAEQIAGFHTGLVQKGVVDGLVRIRADIPKRYTPAEFADIIPVVAKGWEIDENGEYKAVTYNYYFTDKVIQAELTHKVDINHKFNTNSIVANIRTLTRWRASYMTSRSPSWNFWNFFKEAFERGTTLMFRPVVDDNGNRVSGTKLMYNFSKNLTKLAASPQAHEEVYRYLAFREIKTPLQREVHNLYTSGTIQLVTDLTDKYNLMGEQDRAALDNLAIKIEKGLLKAGTKSSFTNWATLKGADLIQQYHLRVAETPQVLNALSMYKAYEDAGVNTREARHRVRDAFDPTRVKSNFMMGLSNFFPFVRSAGAGNYNTMRTFGDVFYRDGAKAKVKFALLGLSAYSLLQIASYVFGDDEDGNDLLAQLPQSELNRGIPFRLSDGKVIYFPVGHGILNMVWSTVTAIHKLMHGTSSVWDLVSNTIDQTVKNIAPIQAPTPDSVANSGGKAIFLNAMPTMVLPIAEVILNQTQFGSNDIVRSETPSGERDSDQDSFTTPEVYKEMAKDLYKITGGVIDWRPENIHHLARAYAGVGPFRAIDASLQDKGEKTAGVFVNKGEYFGPLAIAAGIDSGISTSVLSAESRYWEMYKHKAKILNKYNIQVTMPAGETYDKVDVSHLDLSKENPDRETRAERYAHQLTKAGATREEAQFVINMELGEKTRTKLRKELQTVGSSYYNSIYKGTASEYTKSDTQERAIALRDFYEQAVRDNNQFVYGKK